MSRTRSLFLLWLGCDLYGNFFFSLRVCESNLIQGRRPVNFRLEDLILLSVRYLLAKGLSLILKGIGARCSSIPLILLEQRGVLLR